MSQPARPLGGYASVAGALAAVRSGLAFIARADAASLPAAALADCLRGLEAAESVHTAARARVLAESRRRDRGVDAAPGGLPPGPRRVSLPGDLRVDRRELCQQSGRLVVSGRSAAGPGP
jgi:hypothetical protein